MATQPTQQNDTINAGLGITTIDALAGTDILVIDWSSLTRTIIEDGRTLSDGRFNSVTHFNFEQWNISGGIGDDVFSGGSLADTLLGGAGWDVLTGYGGADIIDGGDGTDTWVDDFSSLTSVASVVIEATTGANTRTQITLGKLAVPTVKNIEALNFRTGSGSDTISVGTQSYNDDIRTGSGNDTINVGMGGSDYVQAGDGIDIGMFNWSDSTGAITVDPYWDDYSDGLGRYVNFDAVERFNLTGGSGNDKLAGDVYNDTLNGGAGRDTLYGSRSGDVLDGGDGVDVWNADYSPSAGAIKITLTKAADANAVLGGISGASVKNIERLVFTSGSGNDAISVGEFAYDDDIRTGGGNDTINAGMGGSDYVHGGDGTDVGVFNWKNSTTDITVDSYWDDYSDGAGLFVNFDAVERFSLIGGAGDDQLAGDVADDTLNGGAGKDTLYGFSGIDKIDGDIGVDLWNADYGQSSNAIKITLTDKLNVNEALGGIPKALVKNIERLAFTSGAGNDVISVGAFAHDDDIRSKGGEDTINIGTGGSDYVDGGDGVDIGAFDWHASTTDITVDPYWDDYYDGEGRYVNFDAVERFSLTGGSGNDYLAGDAWNDTLLGGDGNDYLGSGKLRTDIETYNTDVIDGGDGVDVWQADFSASGETITVVLSGVQDKNAVSGGISDGVTKAVVKNVERLSFVAGAGNDVISTGKFAYDDNLQGGDGDDTLDVGAGGSDYVHGGNGIDIGRFDWSSSTTRIGVDPYWDDYSDLEGHYVNFDFVEQFDLTGGTGGDYLAGDVYEDTLNGGAGDDELDGFGGADALTGGLGADLFNIRSGSGEDVIADFEAGKGLSDVVSFINNPFTPMSFETIQQNLSQDGGDTVLTLTDADSVRFVGVSVNDFAADDFLWA